MTQTIGKMQVVGGKLSRRVMGGQLLILLFLLRRSLKLHPLQPLLRSFFLNACTSAVFRVPRCSFACISNGCNLRGSLFLHVHPCSFTPFSRYRVAMSHCFGCQTGKLAPMFGQFGCPYADLSASFRSREIFENGTTNLLFGTWDAHETWESPSAGPIHTLAVQHFRGMKYGFRDPLVPNTELK